MSVSSSGHELDDKIDGLEKEEQTYRTQVLKPVMQPSLGSEAEAYDYL